LVFAFAPVQYIIKALTFSVTTKESLRIVLSFIRQDRILVNPKTNTQTYKNSIIKIEIMLLQPEQFCIGSFYLVCFDCKVKYGML
jgi:hypothetical protein